VRFASGAWQSLRTQLRLVCAVAMLVCLAAPAALGASMGAVLELVGAQTEHVCKCGMAPGKCGCPECARTERQAARERMPDLVPVLKRQCEQGAPGLQFAALPSAAVGCVSRVLPAPAGERIPRETVSLSRFDRAADPPTPPPRLASV
jgi:hypothetical protein